MTERSIFFNNKTNKVGDATLPYPADIVRDALKTLAEGVVYNASNPLAASAPANTDDLVRVQPGMAWLAGIYYENTAVKDMTVPSVSQPTG